MGFVRLKWGLEYKGYLLSSDAYMNLQLEQCEEYVDGEAQGSLGEVLIRCAHLFFKAHCSRELVPRMVAGVQLSLHQPDCIG